MRDLAVSARCQCGWRSALVEVEDVPNGEWNARRDATVEYAKHYSAHSPPPEFIRVTKQTPATINKEAGT